MSDHRKFTPPVACALSTGPLRITGKHNSHTLSWEFMATSGDVRLTAWVPGDDGKNVPVNIPMKLNVAIMVLDAMRAMVMLPEDAPATQKKTAITVRKQQWRNKKPTDEYEVVGTIGLAMTDDGVLTVVLMREGKPRIPFRITCDQSAAIFDADKNEYDRRATCRMFVEAYVHTHKNLILMTYDRYFKVKGAVADDDTPAATSADYDDDVQF